MAVFEQFVSRCRRCRHGACQGSDSCGYDMDGQRRDVASENMTTTPPAYDEREARRALSHSHINHDPYQESTRRVCCHLEERGVGAAHATGEWESAEVCQTRQRVIHTLSLSLSCLLLVHVTAALASSSLYAVRRPGGFRTLLPGFMG